MLLIQLQINHMKMDDLRLIIWLILRLREVILFGKTVIHLTTHLSSGVSLLLDIRLFSEKTNIQEEAHTRAKVCRQMNDGLPEKYDFSEPQNQPDDQPQIIHFHMINLKLD